MFYEPFYESTVGLIVIASLKIDPYHFQHQNTKFHVFMTTCTILLRIPRVIRLELTYS